MLLTDYHLISAHPPYSILNFVSMKVENGKAIIKHKIEQSYFILHTDNVLIKISSMRINQADMIGSRAENKETIRIVLQVIQYNTLNHKIFMFFELVIQHHFNC